MTYQHNPYIVGDWVRGKNFYGRQEILTRLRHQQNRATLLLGMRRIGKSSLLRQFATLEPAIYLDLQRTGGSWDGFHKGLSRAVRQSQREINWLPGREELKEIADPFELLDELNDVIPDGERLWLLIDEAEILIELRKDNHQNLSCLRSAISDLTKIHFIFASAKQLSNLDELPETDSGQFRCTELSNEKSIGQIEPNHTKNTNNHWDGEFD